MATPRGVDRLTSVSTASPSGAGRRVGDGERGSQAGVPLGRGTKPKGTRRAPTIRGRARIDGKRTTPNLSIRSEFVGTAVAFCGEAALRRAFQARNSRKPCRCQGTVVSGWTAAWADHRFAHTRQKGALRNLSRAVVFCRILAGRDPSKGCGIRDRHGCPATNQAVTLSRPALSA